MSNWEMVRLGDVCKFINGDRGKNYPSAKDFVDVGVPFINAGHINANSIDYSNMNYITEDRYGILGSGKVEKNDILYCLRGSLGKHGLVIDGKGAIASSLVILRGDPQKINCCYLLHYLDSDKIYKQQIKANNGSSQPNLSAASVKEFIIPLPPLDIQKHIADTLDKTQEIIDCHKKQLEELDNLIKATFYDMFGDPVTNNKRWEIVQIKDLSQKIQYGSSEKASTEILEYPILRMNNITYSGEWDFRDLKYINLSEKDKEKYLVYKGEMLFNRTNSKELVGKAATYREQLPMAYAGYLVKLTPNEKANCEFISAFLNSSYGKALLRKMAKSIIGMANINAKELGSIKIYVPPIDLQNKFAQIVTNIESQKATVKQSITQSQNLFNSLMSKYFD